MAKEILFISGKGGTGKTSFTASFASLAENLIICDLDVDAPDLHLLLQPKKLEHHEFWSGNDAFIGKEKCSNCGECLENCRFDAIGEVDSHYVIDPLKCEGCKLCVELCPSKAIDFGPKQSGVWYLSQTRLGKLVHANLLPAEENSGKLVSLLRKEAKELSKNETCDYILCDGPPGIGCPVISSLSGVDVAVIITEPTPSGHHDLSRTIDLCKHFNIPAMSIINKCNINLEQCNEIENLCFNKGVKIIGKVPFNKAFIEALVMNRSIVELNKDSKTTEIFKDMWDNIINSI